MSGPSRRWSTWAVVAALSLAASACPSSDSDDASMATTAAPTASDQVGDATSVDPEFDVVVPEPDDTPIEVDPDVRIGTLDNGLTYYLRRNTAPGGRLELRLAVDAGSLQQDVPDSGLAHFVEHMLFNGTERFPGNELDRVLQGFGMQIGPDVNAYTSYDETVYSLSIPTADQSGVERGFDVLLDWASAASHEEQAVIDERGVVREEHRVRAETPEGQVTQRFDEVYVANSDYADRSPIGTAEQIVATTAADTRRFYDRWYRPDLMAIVAVGDLSLDRMEQEIVDRFDPLEAPAADHGRTDPTAPPLDTTVVDVILDPDTTRPFVSLDYWLPDWDGGTVGGERLLLIDQVLASLIRNRLDDGVERGEIDAISPFVGPFDWTRHRRFLGFNFGGSDLARAAEDVVAELRRLEVSGFEQQELDRVAAEVQGELDQRLESAGTRQDVELAANYVAHFLGGDQIDSIERAHARQSDALSSVTAAEVTDYYRYVMSVSSPLLIVVTPDAESAPTVAALEAALDRGQRALGDDQRTTTEDITELMTQPEPVTELERNRLRGLDGFELVFDNGTRGLFVFSEIADGEVNLLAEAKGGWSLLEPGDGPLAGLAAGAVADSGFGTIDPVQLGRFLSGEVVGLSPYIDETTEGFSGFAAVDDVELLFQLLHLSVTEPRVDDAALRSAREQGETAIRAADVDPSTQSFVELVDARYASHPYQHVVPDPDRLDRFDAEEALQLYQSRLGAVDDLVVAVAGDIDGEFVADLFRRYLGTLPAGPSDTWVDHWPEPPTTVIERTVSAGRDDAGAGVDFLFTGPTDVDDRTELATEVVTQIVRARLFDTVREELGATYGGQIFVEVAAEPDELTETFVIVNGDPERLELIEATVLDEVISLAEDGPTADELERARAITSNDYDLVSNFDLMVMLIDAGHRGDADPFTRAEARSQLRSLSRADIGAAAASMFPTDRWIRVTRAAQG